jgi:hypothetical protein
VSDGSRPALLLDIADPFGVVAARYQAWQYPYLADEQTEEEVLRWQAKIAREAQVLTNLFFLAPHGRMLVDWLKVHNLPRLAADVERELSLPIRDVQGQMYSIARRLVMLCYLGERALLSESAT